MRRFYTIDDLYNFCKTNRFEKFSSVEQGAPLIVQSIGTFEASDNMSDGLMSVKLKSCHTGKNRNRSGISDETMELYKNSFKGRPILGAIYKTDTGEYEFRAHDMKLVESDDKMDIEYIEQPIGVVSQTDEPYLEFDEEMEKNYLMVNGTIFSDYSKAAEILERRKTCKCSVEIAVEEMSYNCEEDYLSIDKFHFCGVTILGYEQDGVTEIQEGMVGSKITINDFSHKQNSVFANQDYSKLIETLEKLNFTLESFHKENIVMDKGGEGDMDKFNELLAKYGKTAEEIPFEVEGLSDEELEAKFEEEFENADEGVVTEEDNIDPSVSDEGEGENTAEVVANAEEEVDAVVENATEESENVVETEEVVVDEKFCRTFTVELSHEDIAGALYRLIEQYEEADNAYYYIREVFDDYFYMQNWYDGKLYKQGYSIDGENVALNGERVEVFELIVTESEKLAIEKMREDYAVLETKYNELKAFKDNYDAAQIKAQKDAIFAKPEYECLVDDQAFHALKEEAEKYSVEEISMKIDLVFAAHVKSVGAFSVKTEENKPKTMGVNFTAKETKKKPYGSLFDKK